ncbi:hypothetical protein SVIOM342S_10450 [Streptomyces violaceorubidus]
MGGQQGAHRDPARRCGAARPGRGVPPRPPPRPVRRPVRPVRTRRAAGGPRGGRRRVLAPPRRSIGRRGRERARSRRRSAGVPGSSPSASTTPARVRTASRPRILARASASGSGLVSRSSDCTSRTGSRPRRAAKVRIASSSPAGVPFASHTYPTRAAESGREGVSGPVGVPPQGEYGPGGSDGERRGPAGDDTVDRLAPVPPGPALRHEHAPLGTGPDQRHPFAQQGSHDGDGVRLGAAEQQSTGTWRGHGLFR